MTGTGTDNLPSAEIGILGGTGLYEIEGIQDVKEHFLETPFGDPSDAYIVGTLEGRRVAFLSRHGRGHRLSARRDQLPGQRLRLQDARRRSGSSRSTRSARSSRRSSPATSSSPTSSSTRPGGRTRSSATGSSAHVGLAEPVCPELAEVLLDAGRGPRASCAASGGTYVCIEGPAFSTKAESQIYRHWGGDVIGMTERHRGQALPRGRDLLRDDEPGHRLRRLARRARRPSRSR